VIAGDASGASGTGSWSQPGGRGAGVLARALAGALRPPSAETDRFVAAACRA